MKRPVINNPYQRPPQRQRTVQNINATVNHVKQDLHPNPRRAMTGKGWDGANFIINGNWDHLRTNNVATGTNEVPARVSLSGKANRKIMNPYWKEVPARVSLSGKAHRKTMNPYKKHNICVKAVGQMTNGQSQPKSNRSTEAMHKGNYNIKPNNELKYVHTAYPKHDEKRKKDRCIPASDVTMCLCMNQTRIVEVAQ